MASNFLSFLGGAAQSVAKFKKAKAVAPTPEAPADTQPVGHPSDDVGLWERLKAGNIDQEGSEAYNRWGKGKADGEQRVADLDESSRLEAKKEFDKLQASEHGLVTMEQQANAPAEIEASIRAIKNKPVLFTKDEFDNAPDRMTTADNRWTEAMRPTEGFLDNK